jgi:hypothetical protein
MSSFHVGSFELGFLLAETFRLIAVDKVLKPSRVSELEALEERIEQLKEDIVSSRITDFSVFISLVREVFSDLSQIRNSYENEQ